MLGNRYSCLAWGVGVTAMLVQPAAIGADAQAIANAKSSAEVQTIAQAVTIKIVAVGLGNASGILLQKQGDVYTVLTARHVTDAIARFQAVTTIFGPDGKSYEIMPQSVRRYQGDMDIAVFKFRSAENYQLAQLGNSNRIRRGMPVYISGFPNKARGLYRFEAGTVLANSQQRNVQLSLISSNGASPGNSGGPVLNEEGQVVGIVSGVLDYQEDSYATSSIPISRFADVARSLDVDLAPAIARTAFTNVWNADDWLVAFYSQMDVVKKSTTAADRKEAFVVLFEQLDKAIELDSQYAFAYFLRGFMKDILLRSGDPEIIAALGINTSFADIAKDYDRAISWNYRSSVVYTLRSDVRLQLKDFQGALEDYREALMIKGWPKRSSPTIESASH